MFPRRAKCLLFSCYARIKLNVFAYPLCPKLWQQYAAYLPKSMPASYSHPLHLYSSTSKFYIVHDNRNQKPEWKHTHTCFPDVAIRTGLEFERYGGDMPMTATSRWGIDVPMTATSRWVIDVPMTVTSRWGIDVLMTVTSWYSFFIICKHSHSVFTLINKSELMIVQHLTPERQVFQIGNQLHHLMKSLQVSLLRPAKRSGKDYALQFNH